MAWFAISFNRRCKEFPSELNQKHQNCIFPSPIHYSPPLSPKRQPAMMLRVAQQKSPDTDIRPEENCIGRTRLGKITGDKVTVKYLVMKP